MRRLSISEFLATNKSWNIGRWLLDWFLLSVYPFLVVLRDPKYYKVKTEPHSVIVLIYTTDILSKVL